MQMSTCITAIMQKLSEEEAVAARQLEKSSSSTAPSVWNQVSSLLAKRWGLIAVYVFE
jgi:hypothetical protein